MFANPTVKVYHALSPRWEDISEILPLVFQGPSKPMDDDIKHTPMLVHRNHVKDIDYEDLYISPENLNSYPLAGVLVDIDYSKSDSTTKNKITSTMSIHDNEFEEGTTSTSIYSTWSCWSQI